LGGFLVACQDNKDADCVRFKQITTVISPVLEPLPGTSLQTLPSMFSTALRGLTYNALRANGVPREVVAQSRNDHTSGLVQQRVK